jgi:hypothetical protein
VKNSGKRADWSGSAKGCAQRNLLEILRHSKLSSSHVYYPARCDENLNTDADENLPTVSEFEDSQQPTSYHLLDTGILQHLMVTLSGLRVVKGAYHQKIDVAVRLAEDLEHLALSRNLPETKTSRETSSFSSIFLPHNSPNEIRELAKACGLLLIFLRRLGGRLATRISRECSNCHVTRVARARLCRCMQRTANL